MSKNCGGRCCEKFYIHHSPEKIKELCKRAELNLRDAEPEEATYIAFKELEALVDMLVLIPDFSRPDIGEYAYTCNRFDRKTRLCSRYDERPPMCRKYPANSRKDTCEFVQCQGEHRRIPICEKSSAGVGIEDSVSQSTESEFRQRLKSVVTGTPLQAGQFNPVAKSKQLSLVHVCSTYTYKERGKE